MYVILGLCLVWRVHAVPVLSKLAQIHCAPQDVLVGVLRSPVARYFTSEFPWF